MRCSPPPSPWVQFLGVPRFQGSTVLHLFPTRLPPPPAEPEPGLCTSSTAHSHSLPMSPPLAKSPTPTFDQGRTPVALHLVCLHLPPHLGQGGVQGGPQHPQLPWPQGRHRLHAPVPRGVQGYEGSPQHSMKGMVRVGGWMGLQVRAKVHPAHSAGSAWGVLPWA